MKRKSLLALLLVPLTLTGCDKRPEDIIYDIIKGEGEVIDHIIEDKDYEKYTSLHVEDIKLKNGRVNVRLFMSATEHKIVVKAQSNINDKINVKYSGSSINIYAGQKEKYETSDVFIDIYGYEFSSVYGSTIRGIFNQGTIGGDNVVLDFSANSAVDTGIIIAKTLEIKATGESYVGIIDSEAESAKCSISGLSTLYFINDCTIGSTLLNISGSSTANLHGTCGTFTANISGSSSVTAEYYVSDIAKMNLSGGSYALAQVNNELTAEISAASALTYYSSNDSVTVVKNLSGGSRIIKGDINSFD